MADKYSERYGQFFQNMIKNNPPAPTPSPWSGMPTDTLEAKKAQALAEGMQDPSITQAAAAQLTGAMPSPELDPMVQQAMARQALIERVQATAAAQSAAEKPAKRKAKPEVYGATE